MERKRARASNSERGAGRSREAWSRIEEGTAALTSESTESKPQVLAMAMASSGRGPRCRRTKISVNGNAEELDADSAKVIIEGRIRRQPNVGRLGRRVPQAPTTLKSYWLPARGFAVVDTRGRPNRPLNGQQRLGKSGGTPLPLSLLLGG